MSNLQIEDYHDFFNSIGLVDPPIKVVHDSKVSFDTRWQATGPITPLTVNDTTAQIKFRGLFRESQATIVWSAREPSLHFAFATDDGPQTVVQPAVIGLESNGSQF